MHVPHRFLDRYEELELWTPFAFGGSYRYPGSPARAISTFTALCSLSTLLVSVLIEIRSDPETDTEGSSVRAESYRTCTLKRRTHCPNDECVVSPAAWTSGRPNYRSRFAMTRPARNRSSLHLTCYRCSESGVLM